MNYECNNVFSLLISQLKKTVQEKTELLCMRVHSVIKFGGELKMSAVQSPSPSRVSYEIKPGCSGLYPAGTCLPWSQDKMLNDFNKTEISVETGNYVI